MQPRYVEYWRERFLATRDLTEYCVVVNTNTKEEDIGKILRDFVFCKLYQAKVSLILTICCP